MTTQSQTCAHQPPSRAAFLFSWEVPLSPRRARAHKPKDSNKQLIDRVQDLFSGVNPRWKKAGIALGTILIIAAAALAKSDSREAVVTAHRVRTDVQSLEREVDDFRPTLRAFGRELDDISGASDQINEAFARTLDERFKEGMKKLRRLIRREFERNG